MNPQRRKVTALGKALSISVLNQMVSSGTNFLLGIYLVRALTPQDFGLYGIGFAVTLFYAGIGNALFLIPMVVNAPDRKSSGLARHAATVCMMVFIFSCVTGVVSVSTILVGGTWWDALTVYASFCHGVLFASIAYLFKDFFIRHAYIVKREIWALEINLWTAACTAALVFAFHYANQPFTVEKALLVYGLGQALGAGAGFLITRLPVGTVTRAEIRAGGRDVWAGGKWLLLTNLVYFARTQAHTFITAAMIGTTGVAQLNAARLLVTPAVLLTPALSQVFMPRLAELRASGSRKVAKVGIAFSAILLTVALIYSACLLALFDWVVPFTIGERYASTFSVTVAWCAVACVLAVRNGGELVLQALRRFQALTVASSLASLIAIIAVFGLIVLWGIPGAVYGLGVGESALALFIWSLIFRNRSEGCVIGDSRVGYTR